MSENGRIKCFQTLSYPLRHLAPTLFALGFENGRPSAFRSWKHIWRTSDQVHPLSNFTHTPFVPQGPKMKTKGEFRRWKHFCRTSDLDAILAQPFMFAIFQISELGSENRGFKAFSGPGGRLGIFCILHPPALVPGSEFGHFLAIFGPGTIFCNT